jgi:predicted NAD/FAD-dependent oxidoreductase
MISGAGFEVLSDAHVAAIARLIDDLVAKRYDAIAERGSAGSLSARNLRGVIVDYGRTLATPRDGWLAATESYATAQGWLMVDVPLWTVEEGRSDLTLSVVIKPAESGGFSIEMLDLHVL